jgi:hypothetical protein
MMAGRYAHAKQFKRHRRQLGSLRARLGRLIRDILRRIKGRTELEDAFEQPAFARSLDPLPRAAPARIRCPSADRRVGMQAQSSVSGARSCRRTVLFLRNTLRRFVKSP